MKNIPEIVWPSGFAKELFSFIFDFNVLMEIFEHGIYFEDEDEIGIFMVYYVELPNLGHLLFVMHKDRPEKTITVYVDKNASPRRSFEYVKFALRLENKDIVWIRPATWDD